MILESSLTSLSDHCLSTLTLAESGPVISPENQIIDHSDYTGVAPGLWLGQSHFTHCLVSPGQVTLLSTCLSAVVLLSHLSHERVHEAVQLFVPTYLLIYLLTVHVCFPRNACWTLSVTLSKVLLKCVFDSWINKFESPHWKVTFYNPLKL